MLQCNPQGHLAWVLPPPPMATVGTMADTQVLARLPSSESSQKAMGSPQSPYPYLGGARGVSLDSLHGGSFIQMARPLRAPITPPPSPPSALAGPPLPCGKVQAGL